MELSHKIQALRKEKGLTQEQFSEKLFVSRTAVSKWETGRGVPNMESLKMIARLCGITLDELLSAEEIIAVAEHETKESIFRYSYLVDGILSVISLLGIVLPLYRVQLQDVFYSVPLYEFHGLLSVFYWALPIIMALCGTVQIAINKCENTKARIVLALIGLIANITEILMLILGGHPYPAVLFFVLLITKGIIMLRKVS